MAFNPPGYDEKAVRRLMEILTPYDRLGGIDAQHLQFVQVSPFRLPAARKQKMPAPVFSPYQKAELYIKLTQSRADEQYFFAIVMFYDLMALGCLENFT